MIYDSVGTNVTAAGVEDIAPKDDAEWARVADNAAALAEAGNMMLVDGRAVGVAGWAPDDDGPYLSLLTLEPRALALDRQRPAGR